MQKFFSMIMGGFISLGTFFHGGTPAKTVQTGTPSDIHNNATVGNDANRPTPDPSGIPPEDFGRGTEGSHGGQPKNGPDGQRNGGPGFFGTLSDVTSTSVTVKDKRGKTMTFTISDATTYKNGTKSSLVAGVTVAVHSKPVSTGTTSVADSIEINPSVPSGTPPQAPPDRSQGDNAPPQDGNHIPPEGK